MSTEIPPASCIFDKKTGEKHLFGSFSPESGRIKIISALPLDNGGNVC